MFNSNALLSMQLADAMELMLLSVLSPNVKCLWDLSDSEEASITSVSYFSIGTLT